MKKLMTILMCLAVMVFMGNAAFADDENDIMKRYQERMKKVVLNTRAQSVKAEMRKVVPVAPEQTPTNNGGIIVEPVGPTKPAFRPVSAELLAQARAVLGDSVTTGIHLTVPEGMRIEGGAEQYYDASGKLIGQHQWDPTRNMDEWLKVNASGQLMLIVKPTGPVKPGLLPVSAGLLAQAQAILGDSVTMGYFITVPEGMRVEGSGEQYYDASGKLIGQHQRYPNENGQWQDEWLKVDASGQLVLIIKEKELEGGPSLIPPPEGIKELEGGPSLIPPIVRTDEPHPVDNNGDGYADGDPLPVDNGPIVVTSSGPIIQEGKGAEVRPEADNLGGDTKVYPEVRPEAGNLGGDTKVYQELSNRKAIEAQIELKGNGKNYTVSTQMAGAPEEGVQLQKKQ